MNLKIFDTSYQTNNIWFMSDPHYHHKGIVRGTSQWEDTSICRDFNTLKEHDDALVNNINSCVKESDILISLGDWSFGDYKTDANITNIRKFREQLVCNRIIHVYGNHDQELRKNKDNSQELFMWVGDYLELTISEDVKEQGIKPIKQKIVCSHYAMKTWNNSRTGSWQLHGHSHGSLGYEEGKTMDVGVDCHPKFRPFSYLEIKELLQHKSIFTVDHHI